MIAEVKRASPSKGLLAPHFDPVALAQTYEAHGAAAISVLTEPHFFLGSPEYLTAIKQCGALCLCCAKISSLMSTRSTKRARGARMPSCSSAPFSTTSNCCICCTSPAINRMHCLVEVHSAEEAQRAVAAGATIIGVNSRDLVTFQMNPYLIRELRPAHSGRPRCCC